MALDLGSNESPLLHGQDGAFPSMSPHREWGQGISQSLFYKSSNFIHKVPALIISLFSKGPSPNIITQG